MPTMHLRHFRGGVAARRGTTLLELVIVLSIILLTAFAVFPSLIGKKSRGDLEHATVRVASLLREAHGRSVAQTLDSAWGVHFENSTSSAPSFSLFSYPYSTSTVIRRETFSPYIRYATSVIAEGGTLTIVFNQLTGFSASGSISIALELIANHHVSSTIAVATSGFVSAAY